MQKFLKVGFNKKHSLVLPVRLHIVCFLYEQVFKCV